ncbi:MAG: hypothetical protein WCK51_08010 [Armatimonadota bacterium]
MILALLLQSNLATAWPDLPNPTACWSDGTHYKLVLAPTHIQGEPHLLKLRIQKCGRKTKTIIIDDSPGYYEQLAICPRPGGVLIAGAPWRNVRFWAVDRARQLWTIPLMLSSDEGLIGVNKQGIVYLESERRQDSTEIFRLRVFSAKKLDLVDYQP